MPITSLNFQELVTSIELGLWVEKASGPTVRTRRYLPFHECLVTKNDEAAGLMAIIFLIFNTFLSDSTCFSEKTNLPRFFHSFAFKNHQNLTGNANIENFAIFCVCFDNASLISLSLLLLTKKIEPSLFTLKFDRKSKQTSQC